MNLEKGDRAINNHPYAFRSGEPYTVLDIVKHNHRDCFMIQFDDWVIDWFPVSDIGAHDVRKLGNKTEES